MRTPEQYYEIYRDFKGMLVERVNVSCMHINNINATCKIADLDKIHAITFMVYAKLVCSVFSIIVSVDFQEQVIVTYWTFT